MNKLLLAVAMSVLAVSATAGDSAEIQIVNGQPTLDLYISGKVSGRLGWSAFGLVNEGWGQAYAGPTFAPTSWSEVGFSVGVESGGKRFAESLWLGKGRVSVLAIHEHGYTGSWHKVTADVAMAKGLSVGYHDQAFLGRGPRVQLTRGKVSVWSALLLKDGHTNTVVALLVKS